MSEQKQDTISAKDWRHLKELGWVKHAGSAAAIWIRPGSQCLMLLREGRTLRAYPCSTSAAGLGNRNGSLQTPTGWHAIGAKTGGDVPIGAILKDRKWTGQVWRPGDASAEDMVLSRILRLAGLEEGVNLGGEVDTWQRYIYIHGTNAEHSLGRPSSRGCIRLSNKDVVDLYERVSLGCRVLIAD